MKIEYRIRAVERYIVTRFEEDTEFRNAGSRQIGGEHDNAEVAYQVAYALARKEQEDLGLPPGDMGVIFPERLEPSVQEAGNYRAL